MNTKKQQASVSSSETSSSNSSSSSSSSSGSSNSGSSSESDGSSSEKPPKEPPRQANTTKEKKGAAIYSSESEESTTTKRWPLSKKPKATATAVMKKSPVKKQARGRPANKSKTTLSKVSTAPRSIFSPDNSTDSEEKKKKSSVSSSQSSSSSESSSESESSSSIKVLKTPNKETIRKATRTQPSRPSRPTKSMKSTSVSDSDSDAKPCKSKLRPNKTPSRSVQRPSKSSNQQLEVKRERACPLEGCDGSGHLAGFRSRHFTLAACPLYHNKTAIACRNERDEWKRRVEERKKALMVDKKLRENRYFNKYLEQVVNKRSPKPGKGNSGGYTTEQRSYQQKVKEMRVKHMGGAEGGTGGGMEGKREPRLDDIASEYDLMLFRDAQAVASERIEEELEKLPNSLGTRFVEMGRFEMEVWYQSPYPEEVARMPKLYLCEFCLKYMTSRTVLTRHVDKCVWWHPPGEEVYRNDRLSVWEVDGKKYKQYCQNLCLLAKFFLDHKTLYYDVEPFLFYIMTITDSEGCHTVGYFSKEKNSFLNYNVSCILTLPPYQRQGYGRLLIDFSYLLTRAEGKIGSPEKPLSDLGLISYRSYWKDVLLEYLCKFAGKEISIKDISQEMGINSYDIVSTLQALGMIKYWKGKHIILKKQEELDEYLTKSKRRDMGHKSIDPKFLKWSPYTPPVGPQNQISS